jgi:hypothetical protein
MRHGWLTLLAWLLPAPALAGSPFATDDPEPTEANHWEIYGYVDTTFEDGQRQGTFGLDIGYGLRPDVQVSVVLPIEFDSAAADPAQPGDAEIGVKWKFFNDAENHRSLAIFPRVILPTGHGSKRASLMLPIWGQQVFGAWSIYGGGGYILHPGTGNRNFWQEGIAVTRQFSDRFTLGAEFSHKGSDIRGGHGASRFAIGGIVGLNQTLSLLLLGGPQFEDSTGKTAAVSYAAILVRY